MLKITGCFLILYASFMTGHAVGSFHTRMVSELEELILLIQIIKNQIIYEGTELPELLARCEKRTKGAVKMWLHSLNEDVSGGRDKPFGELWRDSMAVLSDLSAVRADVVEEIGRLGDILGDMDADAQISRISLIENIITDKYERERNRNGGIRKLSNSLGILAGLFIVIMLL
ncbi:stage III sporulation protein AB [Coprococcus eutactus]|uniref:stage III sporulation protein AB n=1 Tax=Coprococcus eutactus TaxID=33043 RepID=UPI003219E1E8